MAYYHVRISQSKSRRDDEVKLDLADDELEQRFLFPYRRGHPITVGGTTIMPDDIERIRINKTDQSSEYWLPIVKRERLVSGVVTLTSDEWYVAHQGEDVTDLFIMGPPGHESATDGAGARELRPATGTREVFVVHGRNEAARDTLFAFLRAIDLHPLEWSEAVQATGRPTPYIGEILDAAFSRAMAVVILLTPDDEARLNIALQGEHEPPFETELTGQARPNVLFEAGMAMGRDQDRTVLVELGALRPFSDVAGRHVVRLDNTPQRRQELANRLKIAGCPVNLEGADWYTVGDFTVTN